MQHHFYSPSISLTHTPSLSYTQSLLHTLKHEKEMHDRVHIFAAQLQRNEDDLLSKSTSSTHQCHMQAQQSSLSVTI